MKNRSTTHTLHLGKPYPLGATTSSKCTNFAIYAREPTHAVLILREPHSNNSTEYKLTPSHRSGLVWHASIAPPVPRYSYLWRIGTDSGPWITNECVDPYARLLHTATGCDKFCDRAEQYNPWAVVEDAQDEFDWQDVARPQIAWKDVIIYEIHIRGFTKRLSELDGDLKNAGSFQGVVKRIPYLKALGVNVVELLPCMEFNESEWSGPKKGDSLPPGDDGKHLCQYWGYSTVGFFSVMNRFASKGSSPQEAKQQFQHMVRELHRAGIEVILDVVFNHTAEMGFDYVGRGFYGMKLLAPHTYYLWKDGGKQFVNLSGCGNTVNCNDVIVQDLICDSLRYWRHEMGVDGFRFDLASILCRGTDGQAMSRPSVVERMCKEACMRDVKFIAEPWDCGGLYQVGAFPHFGVWAEWNGKFRDCVRRFIRGDGGVTGEFATRLCGSEDLYSDGRKPYHSINFVTAHDGFCMRDLVSYNEKHNERNGENNRDGEAHNVSWNCGAEGDTTDDGVVQLRERQIRNLMMALLMGGGTPLLRMGDEYGHSQGGNNNGWCQDSDISWFDWSALGEERGGRVAQFAAALMFVRADRGVLRRERFLTEGDVKWHGENGTAADWSGQSRNVLCMTLVDRKESRDVLVAFNASGEGTCIKLVSGGGVWEEGARWLRVVDTSLVADGREVASTQRATCLAADSSYELRAFSSALFVRVDSVESACTTLHAMCSKLQHLRVLNGA
ncbi:Isoamylase 3, chloroplastic [Gracilariopsis chorda]|uniref:Isoamylase 3, chloroplastic n=1 Tax=Gracilariopsis chorda TaxID=448386 RepID=A0A2V3IST1_9FLOR|nr:Isoamylase 3, chloroplastic [Gracilariopsis chorda]|eukprot:PXF44807.1 Isoamylase 3, chloroplastic [Gracilariopsis chorda]